MATLGIPKKGRGRGRVVMLVDNGVNGDSRVQKTARSAAAAGWDVILIGQRGQSKVDAWQIGGAEVRLVEMDTPMALAPLRFRRSLLRRPFAYPPGRTSSHRMQQVRARRADTKVKLAVLRAARLNGGPQWRETLGKALLAPSQAFTEAFSLWVRFRKGQLHRLQNARANPDSVLTRTNIAFWKAVRGDRSWRSLDPALWDYELAFGAVVDALEPDLIHANDFRMLGVGARATLRARGAGRPTKLVWDAHELVSGLSGRKTNARWLPAQVAHEKEFGRHADAVLTVSPALAELLQKAHHLPELPSVVMNSPDVAELEIPDDVPLPKLRTLCGVSETTPLLVYCGGITHLRGVFVMIEALSQLPDVHVALVSLHPSSKNQAPRELEARAVELGVADRVHMLPYVEHWQVVPLLREADAAVSGLLHLPNHEIALSNKFFEYSQARLPLIVSDVRTMSEMVTSTGQGEVFIAGDVDDYARAVRKVLADPKRYVAAYDKPGLLEKWTWQAQAEVIEGVYSRLLPDRPRTPAAAPPAAAPVAEAPVAEAPPVTVGPREHAPVAAPQDLPVATNVSAQ
jgi:glycogen(starch) synthase